MRMQYNVLHSVGGGKGALGVIQQLGHDEQSHEALGNFLISLSCQPTSGLFRSHHDRPIMPSLTPNHTSLPHKPQKLLSSALFAIQL